MAVDLLGSATAWTLFYLFRKAYLEPIGTATSILSLDQNYFKGWS